ncbi:DUF808 domain-containing protein [Aureimonas sp. AU4]|uniref:DUF808 domain-containing protein n=1 Tax=Aureimonas sp. AU4 TaxID=1638163 RepID=UPI0007825522|nr:DUF808 domain-containing protein [Aureimonas sp. AU4]
MSIGLIALLDDLAAIAKVAAASLDDVATLSAKASVKAAGVVIDDAAVTPRYVVGFSPDRELPIVGRIALGSLRNKLVFLLPAALLLSAFAPWAITPLLAIGGAYLAYEGSEKVWEAFLSRKGAGHEGDEAAPKAANATALEEMRVQSAVKTDFILSAEIMTVTLGGLPDGSIWVQAGVLAAVGIALTGLVYGGVALIVKADDVGLALARRRAGALAAVGRTIVRVMPGFLHVLALVGTAAMIWVGGGILLHALEVFGFAAPAHLIESLSVSAGESVPFAGGLVEWIVGAIASGVMGLLAGSVVLGVVSVLVKPFLGREKPAVASGGSKP